MHVVDSHERRSRWIASAAVLCTGAVAGQLIVIWISLCGTSAESLLAVMAGFAASSVMAQWLARAGLARASYGLQAGLTLCAAWFAPALMNAAFDVGCNLAGSDWPLLAMAAPAIILALILAAAGHFSASCAASRELSWLRRVIAGVPGVSILLIHGIPAWQPWPVALTVSLAIGLTVAAKMMIQQVAGTPEVRPQLTRPRHMAWLLFISCFASGMMLTASGQQLQQIFELTCPLLFTAATLAALVVLTVTHPRLLSLLTPTGLLLVSALALACGPALRPELANFAIALTVRDSSVWLQLIWQSLPAALMFLAATVPVVVQSRGTGVGQRSFALALLTGAATAVVFGARGGSPSIMLAAGLGLTAVVQIGMLVATIWPSGRPSRLRIAAAPLAILMCAGFAFQAATDDSHLSAIVFSQRTRAAIQRGVATELLPHTDARRIVTTAPSTIGEISVWSRSGNVFEFLRDGRGIGRISSDTALAPQPPEEVLPAVMALICHPMPQRVLVLGDESGICLQTCTHFPLQQIIAVRTDDRITELARDFTWRGQRVSPDEDTRVTIRHGRPTTSLRDQSLEQFDVVIVAQPLAMSPDAASQLTCEFYQSASSRLHPDGVFCQRLRIMNPSADALTSFLATLTQEFAQAAAIQIVPGEFLLLATNAERGLIDSGLLTRLQRDHVRREISATGWDWSQVAVLPLLRTSGDMSLLTEQRASAISITNGRWAMAAPFDASHEDRTVELQRAFQKWQQQLIAGTDVTDDHREAQRRLESLTQQLEILTGIPDEPWTYRRSLRMEMQRNPRPPQSRVEPGDVAQVAHPLDLLRQDYFTTLGSLLRTSRERQLTGDDLGELSVFAEAGEPLLSHFAHYELIRLHELSNHPLPSEEFRNRLHIVFYSTPSDASVRPVIGAIRQLVQQPQLIADPAERFDQLNSLMQKLIERWEARTAWEPRSVDRVQNDVDQSVHVAMLALDMMDQDRHVARVSDDDFRQRRKFVTAALLSPLRAYREQVLAHRAKSAPPADPGSEDPDDLPLLIAEPAAESGLRTN